MHTLIRSLTIALVISVVALSLAACGEGGETAETDDTGTNPGGAQSAAETEVLGMPAEFPADIPVHPGTVTSYEPTQVTDTTVVHQLYVESRASFAEVVQWYQTSLPADWSVGYFEDVDNEGDEAKIALDGPGYTDADPEGVGGGVLVGVFANDDATLIVTTVAIMESP